jgi:hypothetical protein
MTIIVTCHPAAVAFIRAEYPEMADARVLASATLDDVRGADVIGNLPLSMAALCRRYRVVEFSDPPPRGEEYSSEAMRAAGPVLWSTA